MKYSRAILPPKVNKHAAWQRKLAAAVIMSAIDDYHTAKKELAKRKITDVEDAILEAIADYSKTDYRNFNDILSNGLQAYSWLKGAPVRKGVGWLSFKDCCELVGMDPEQARVKAKSAGVWRMLNRHNT